MFLRWKENDDRTKQENSGRNEEYWKGETWININVYWLYK